MRYSNCIWMYNTYISYYANITLVLVVSARMSEIPISRCRCYNRSSGGSLHICVFYYNAWSCLMTLRLRKLLCIWHFVLICQKKYTICKFPSAVLWHRNAINMICALYMYNYTIVHLYMLTNCSCVYLLCIRCAHCQNLKFCINMIFNLYMTVYIYSFNNSVRRSSYL